MLGVRVKDKHAPWARERARAVNTAWNFDNEVSQRILHREGRFATAADLHVLTRGAGKEGLPIHSQTLQAVNEEFVARRAQFKRAKLRWRVSDPKSSRYSLGWVPFKKSAIAHRRKDFLHKLSTSQARRCAAVFVGDVDAKALAQTRMAKSVLDAGWSAYRTMLKYKCDDAGVWFKEVDERFSTQECSVCHAHTGPKGREGLSVRAWTCSGCGTEHDRDVNAARNIRDRGLVWLGNEFSKAAEARADDTALNESAGFDPSALAPGHGRPAGGIPVL